MIKVIFTDGSTDYIPEGNIGINDGIITVHNCDGMQAVLKDVSCVYRMLELKTCKKEND